MRQIFTERVASILIPHAQQTNRLAEIRMLVGRALGGRSGQRLLSRLGMPRSRHTLLRQVTRAEHRSSLPTVIRVAAGRLIPDGNLDKRHHFNRIFPFLRCKGNDESFPPPERPKERGVGR